MNYLRKKKIKKFFKEKWAWFLGTGLFLIIGGTVAIIGFQMSGWSIIKWLQSPFATTTLVFLIGGLYGAIMIIILYKKYEMLK